MKHVVDADRSWRRHEIAKRLEDIRTNAEGTRRAAERLVEKIEAVMPELAAVATVKELPPCAHVRVRRKALEPPEAGR